MIRIACQQCGTDYPSMGLPYRCDRCGGIFDIASLPQWSFPVPETGSTGIWRYRHMFGLPDTIPPVTLGEGGTPLVLGEYGGKTIGYKLESQNPTASYKDRATSVLATHLVDRGIQYAVEDSSGNAGASFAAYAARAGISGKVFVPESASGPKLRQIEHYGAILQTIPGPRSAAAKAVADAAEGGAPYASHAYLPFGMLGIMTIAFEMVDQMTDPIGTVIAPVGHGSLLLGIFRGFEILKNAGIVNDLPAFIGVQASECAPIFNSVREQTNHSEGRTIAEGVRVAEPIRGAALLEVHRKGQLMLDAIPEEEILPAMEELAHCGIYGEPTSALVWASCKKWVGSLKAPILLVISGHGLKYSG